jgi:hypothetical protein
MRCTWCNTDSDEAAARHEGPHATWCVHYRNPKLQEGMTVEVKGGRKEYHYRPPPGSPLAGTNVTGIILDGIGAVSVSGMTDALTRDQEESMREKLAWSGDYDGTTCPNCGRERMLLCANGKRRCEKCNWDPDAKDYSEGPYIG